MLLGVFGLGVERTGMQNAHSKKVRDNNYATAVVEAVAVAMAMNTLIIGNAEIL